MGATNEAAVSVVVRCAQPVVEVARDHDTKCEWIDADLAGHDQSPAVSLSYRATMTVLAFTCCCEPQKVLANLESGEFIVGRQQGIRFRLTFRLRNLR